MCFSNPQPYVRVRFHDQFGMWYQNSYMIVLGGGDRLARVGYCGAVNIGHDDDHDLWLYLEYRVVAILVPLTKSELIEEGVWSAILIFGRGMEAKNLDV